MGIFARQWHGLVRGTNDGTVTLNLEKRKGDFGGNLIYIDSNSLLPSFLAKIKFQEMANENNKRYVGFSNEIFPINPVTRLPDQWENVQQHFEIGVTFPSSIRLEASLEDDNLDAVWTTDIGTNGHAHMSGSTAGRASDREVEELSWRDFHDTARDLYTDGYLFRGQSLDWRLRTSFHRHGRTDFIRYWFEDTPKLIRQLSSLTKRRYKQEDPQEVGALLNLAQHHGFPTPLLDWTESPYIAAYFAYHGSDTNNRNVRVYALNKERWVEVNAQHQSIFTADLTLSVLELLALENNRVFPQQSVTMFSNIDDIEQYIEFIENTNKESYLKVFSLPCSDRSIALKELRSMGITPGSLFPGVDGVCRELRERYF